MSDKKEDLLAKCDALIDKLTALNKSSKTTRSANNNKANNTKDFNKNNENAQDKALANRLASILSQRNMLGTVPKQPTNKELFGHLVPNEQMIKTAEDKWNNVHTDWLKEAVKPISSRFSSEEEEEAYWASIKVSDRDDGKPGY